MDIFAFLQMEQFIWILVGFPSHRTINKLALFIAHPLWLLFIYFPMPTSGILMKFIIIIVTSIFFQDLSRVWPDASQQHKVYSQPLVFSETVVYPWNVWTSFWWPDVLPDVDCLWKSCSGNYTNNKGSSIYDWCPPEKKTFDFQSMCIH